MKDNNLIFMDLLIKNFYDFLRKEKMKKRQVLLTFMVIILSFLLAAPFSYTCAELVSGELITYTSAEVVPNELIVKFKPGTSKAKKAELMAKHGLEHKRSSYKPDAFEVLITDSPSGAIEDLKKDPSIEFAEPNYFVRAFMIPSDPYYKYQWHMRQIKMEAAWDLSNYTSNGDNVIVAVIDTGVDENTPDLAGVTFVPGINTLDNNSDTIDDHMHGTHVAGTIAQATNNVDPQDPDKYVGVAGIACNVHIMPIKVLDANGYGDSSSVADGIIFAADEGADVINMSLGVPADQPPQALLDAVNYAYNTGVVIVCAAGNTPDDTPNYPAAFDNTISVSSVGYDKVKASYSSYGTTIDIAAPGGDKPEDINQDGYSDGVIQHTFWINQTTWEREYRYYFLVGTSMACPHVAGVAALIVATGEATTHDEVKSILVSTAEDIDNPSTTDDDDYYGCYNGHCNTGGGLLDAHAAIYYAVNNTMPSDMTPPEIYGLKIDWIADTTADFLWYTTEPSETYLEYGTTAYYGTTYQDTTMKRTHSFTLTGLTAETLYHFRVKAADASYNETVTEDDSFMTLCAGSWIWYSKTIQPFCFGGFIPNLYHGTEIIQPHVDDPSLDPAKILQMRAHFTTLSLPVNSTPPGKVTIQNSADEEIIVYKGSPGAPLWTPIVSDYTLKIKTEIGLGQQSECWSIDGYKYYYCDNAPDITPPAIPTGLNAEAPESGGMLNLSWYANDESDLAGYKVYYGTSSQTYENSIDVGNVTEYSLTGLINDTLYYIAITSYDTSNNESNYSTQITGIPTTESYPEDLPEGWTTELYEIDSCINNCYNVWQYTWIINEPEAERIMVHFTEIDLSQDQTPPGIITIKDENDAVIATYINDATDVWTQAVSGDTIKITIKTGFGSTCTGFFVDQYSYYLTPVQAQTSSSSKYYNNWLTNWSIDYNFLYQQPVNFNWNYLPSDYENINYGYLPNSSINYSLYQQSGNFNWNYLLSNYGWNINPSAYPTNWGAFSHDTLSWYNNYINNNQYYMGYMDDYNLGN